MNWQPINTVPKYKTVLLIKKGWSPFVGHITDDWYVIEEEKQDCVEDYTPDNIVDFTVTHWAEIEQPE